MSQIKEVNAQMLDGINKNDQGYQALWGKEDFTPEETIEDANDYNCGAICNQLEYLTDKTVEYTTQEIDELPSDTLELFARFFLDTYKRGNEDNPALINRIRAVLERDGLFQSPAWGTPWDIKNVLSYFLDRNYLFYVPNYIITDIMVNGGFDSPISTEWNILPSGDRSLLNTFSGQYKLDFASFTSADQDISVVEGSYILNAFYKSPSTGNALKIIIQRDSDSYYYDADTMTWGVSLVENIIVATQTTKYELIELFVISAGTDTINIKFEKILDILLDHIEFGLKLYPYYQIIYVDVTGASPEFASMWGDVSTTYENASYLDQDFMFSLSGTSYTETFIQALLEDLTAAGVQVIFTKETRL